MNYDLIIAGSGGQGILACGKLFAHAAMKENYEVTFFPSYGAEVRGGTTRCGVKFSKSPIASPIIDQADTLLVFNEPSLKKYLSYLKKGGSLLFNSTLIQADLVDGLSGYSIASIPATEMAISMGNEKVTNMIMAGFFMKHNQLISKTNFLDAFEMIFSKLKPELKNLNKQAIEKGITYAGQSKISSC